EPSTIEEEISYEKVEEEISTEVETSENSTAGIIEDTEVEINELSESEEISETEENDTEEIFTVTASSMAIEIAVEETFKEEESISEEDDIEFLKSIGKYEIVTSTE